MNASLTEAVITQQGAIVCPRHHSAFELTTGRVLEWAPWPPGFGRILGAVKQEKPLRVFPTRVSGGRVFVDVGG
jgi:nitrite reductase/ring-hydroxylating ferredoxin subunit